MTSFLSFDPWADLAQSPAEEPAATPSTEHAGEATFAAFATFAGFHPEIYFISPDSAGEGSADPLRGEWSEGVAQLGTMARPARIRPKDWQQMIADAARFLDGWATQAADLGWTTLDIFGAHPTHPVQRIDCAGLVLLLRGAEVVAISSGTICTRNRSGAKLTYRRRPLPESVPLWRLK